MLFLLMILTLLERVNVAKGNYALEEEYQISLAENQKIRIQVLATEKQQFSIQLGKNSSVVALHIEFNRITRERDWNNKLLSNYVTVIDGNPTWGKEQHHGKTDIAWSESVYVIIGHQENVWKFVINGGEDTYSNDRSPFNASDVEFIVIQSDADGAKPQIQRIDVQPVL